MAEAVAERLPALRLVVVADAVAVADELCVTRADSVEAPVGPTLVAGTAAEADAAAAAVAEGAAAEVPLLAREALAEGEAVALLAA